MGDTGVAVNPNDERYKHLVGKTCILPLMDREIPIVADEYVEMDFGTGCVKMTPAHDPNDFEVGLRHNLDTIRVLDDNGKVNANGGKYEGMDRYEAARPWWPTWRPWAHGEDRGLLPQRGHLLPLPQRRGAHHLRPVVREDEAPGRGGHQGGGGRGDPLRPRPLCQDLSELDGERPRLVHLPSAVVGPPDPRVVLRRLRPHDRSPRDATECEKCHSRNIHRDPTCWTPGSPAPCGPFSTLGWPEKTEDLDYLLSHRRAGHRL